MDTGERPSRLPDALLTIVAVWAALILGGLAGARLQPGLAGAAVSLAVDLALLLAWGCRTGAGRRTPLVVFLVAGMLYWLLCAGLFLAVWGDVAGRFGWFAAGTIVGYQYDGGPHTAPGYYVLPMILNLFGPILVMGLLRSWLRRGRAG